jgi:2-polyprenyl-6-methoxyphenol hydroxylase-like FAD-dependent oxidoreductase
VASIAVNAIPSSQGPLMSARKNPVPAINGGQGRRRGRRAVIVGGSMSGLFTAAFLRQIGWEIDVYERSPVELVGRGAGIVCHPELLETLGKSGAGTRNLGVEVEKRIAIDSEGRIIGERALRQIMTSWDRLQNLLRATIPPQHYHLGHTFQDVDQDGSGVRVRFAEGRTERADLLIGCDGIRSGVRTCVAPEVQPAYAGYYIWRGTANEADLAQATLASIFANLTFFLPERQQVIGYPIAGLDNDLRPGRRRHNFIWYRPGDALELNEMCCDEAGYNHKFSVPPPLIRKDLVARMRTDAKQIMPPAFLNVLDNIERPFFTPVYDFVAPRFVFGRVALVGDAAATARPHTAFGVSKAGVDALAFAKALGDCDEIDAALVRYDAQRRNIAERIMLHGRKLGTFLGVEVKTEGDRIMAKLLSDHDGQLDWFAIPNFLSTAVARPRQHRTSHRGIRRAY